MERTVSTLSVVLSAALAASVAAAQPAVADRTVTEAQYEQWKTELTNWGRWGADDEIGALNLVTPAKRLQAVALVQEGITVSLASDADTVEAVDNPYPYEHEMVGISSDRIAVRYHGISHTHLDALAHINDDGVFYNGYAPDADATVEHGHRSLAKVPERDVGPHVAAHIENDPVEPRERVEELRGGVVGLDLRRVRVPGEAEPLDEFPRDPMPVDVGAGNEVRVVVPDRAVELAHDGHGRDRVELALEARGEDRHLLAGGGGRRRLAVRVRQHGGARVRVREATHRCEQLAHRRQQHLRARVGEHHRVGEVVDVLRGACEVDELACRGELDRG